MIFPPSFLMLCCIYRYTWQRKPGWTVLYDTTRCTLLRSASKLLSVYLKLGKIFILFNEVISHRYLCTSKLYMRNRSCLEGSVAEGYLADKCLTFCGRYFEGIETRVIWPIQNDEYNELDSNHSWSVFSHTRCLLGRPTIWNLDLAVLALPHGYVIFNCIKIQEYREYV